MRPRLRHRRAGEVGAATVLAVALVALLVSFAVACGLAVAAVGTHRRAEAAADLAALAGAQAVQSGDDGCAAARRIARANGARLDRCLLLGFDVVVTVRVAGPALAGGDALLARARAGPDQPGGPVSPVGR